MNSNKSLFGSDIPLIQAPMAGIQDSQLTIAVCNAGAIGSLPCAMIGLETMAREIQAIKAHSDGVFNVNFFCHNPPVAKPGAQESWRKTLAGYYAELDIDPGKISPAPPRAPFDEAMAELIEESRPPIVSFHFGLPNENLLGRVKHTGAKVLSSATTVEEALWLEANGADAVIAQGIEAGGHRGSFLSGDLTRQLGIFSLIPQIVNAVKIPVIAAGGISSAAGVQAAMALGAAGVQAGTAFLLCQESKTSEIHRQAIKSQIQSPHSRHTALTNVFSGRPARSIVNRVISEIGPICDTAPAFPTAAAALAPLRAAAESAGRGDFTSLWCGQNPEGCAEVGAAEMVARLTLDSSES